MGLLNQNALVFCQEAFIPVSTDFLGYEGLKRMVEYIQKTNRKSGTEIKVSRIIPTM